MEKNLKMLDNRELIYNIKQLIINARQRNIIKVNTELLVTYWEIGKQIVEFEQKGENRAQYGKELVKTISKELTKELGKGFSISNIQFMRRLYEKYPKQQTLSVKLSWSHYCELLLIEDDNERAFYEKETISSNWSVRELKRQRDSALYQRILLSGKDASKQKIEMLARNGQQINEPRDLVKDPYILEFLGLPESKPFLEKDLEKRLIFFMEKFLLELRKRLYVCRFSTKSNIRQYTSLCRYGVLQ